ncbi:hypothetical protein [Hyphomicrobium sp. CS1GBMeth3]|uniref:hypothetical protein n=1 Tax=Hyphomicrobium sp. CS1GBMeth3 TaxID=1892845 RepID=UPI0009311F2A|nr:hypothetical protein [Hyphomicrobium sp. CS1GBMeth3]
MKLPSYQAGGTLDIGGGPRLRSPDTAIASAFSSVGRTLIDASEDISRRNEKQNAKLQAERERSENLQLEYDLLQTQNRWQEKLQEAQENSSPDAANFTEDYQRGMEDDVSALTTKYANHHDQDYVRLKIAQAQNPLIDGASKFEFTKSLEFRKTVLDEKVASISSSFAAGPGVTLEQAEAEFKEFVDKSISVNPKVREQGYKYGLRTIQSAYIASLAGRDKEAFLENYKKTISADANSAVLPPHISTTIANAQAQGADPQTILAIGWIESRLNPNAGRPTRKDGTQMSSAEGMFQVLAGDNPTAEATRNALGLTRADVRDVNKVSAGLSTFLVRKQEWMRANGIEPTPGKTYMMWNLGEGAAAAVMRANPNERIETVLSRVWASKGPAFVQTALNNNPSMYKPGMTVGQVIANYEQKMGSAKNAVGKITAGAGLTVEDRAKTFVTQFAGISPDNQHVTAADLAKTAEDVIADYGKEQKANLELERGRARLNGELPMDPYSSDHKKDVEKALELNFPPLVEGIAQGDGGSLSTVRSIAGEVRHIPEPLRNAMRTTLETGEPSAKSRVYGTLLDLRKADRTAFNASNFDGDTKKRIEEFEAYTTEMLLPPETAISRIDKARSEDGKVRSQVMSSDINKELGKVTDRKLISNFSGAHTPLGSLSVGSADYDLNRLTPLIRSHYETVYRDAREDGKDKSEADALAMTSLRSAFGVSSAAASSGAIITMHPPEAHYPALWDGQSKWSRSPSLGSLASWGENDGHAWIIEQARNRVAVYLLTTGRIKGDPGLAGGKSGRDFKEAVPAWKEAEDKAKSIEIRLIPTAQTTDDVRRGRPPSYQLWFRNDRGQVEMVEDSFVPDVEEASFASKTQFKAGHRPKSQMERDVQRWLNDPDGHGVH